MQETISKPPSRLSRYPARDASAVEDNTTAPGDPHKGGERDTRFELVPLGVAPDERLVPCALVSTSRERWTNRAGRDVGSNAGTA